MAEEVGIEISRQIYRRQRLVSALAIAAIFGLAAVVNREANGRESDSRRILFSDARSFVLAIDEIEAEFHNNSTCTVNELAPANEGACNYFLLHVSCQSVQGRKELLRDYTVNKGNGDVEVIARDSQIIIEPRLSQLQHELLKRRGIADQMIKKTRNISGKGCLYE